MEDLNICSFHGTIALGPSLTFIRKTNYGVKGSITGLIQSQRVSESIKASVQSSLMLCGCVELLRQSP